MIKNSSGEEWATNPSEQKCSGFLLQIPGVCDELIRQSQQSCIRKINHPSLFGRLLARQVNRRTMERYYADAEAKFLLADEMIDRGEIKKAKRKFFFNPNDFSYTPW